MKYFPAIWVPLLTLFVAIISLLFLSEAWFTVVIENRSYTSRLLLDVLGCIPYIWAFFFGGILLSFKVPEKEIGFFSSLILGICGGLLYSRLSWLLLEPGDSLFNHLSFCIRYFYPLFLSLGGFMIGRLWRQKKSLSGQST